MKRAVIDRTSRRGNRLVEGASGWSVRIREGVALGPYNTRFDAELTAHLLVSRLEQARSEGECRAIIGTFVVELPGQRKARSRESVAQRRAAPVTTWGYLREIGNMSLSESLGTLVRGARR